MSKPYDTEFVAILKEIAPGQIIPHLILEGKLQAAPSYAYIIPPELLKDGQCIKMRKVVKGIRRGVDWEVEALDNDDIKIEEK